jgi:hypothetical protein
MGQGPLGRGCDAQPDTARVAASAALTAASRVGRLSMFLAKSAACCQASPATAAKCSLRWCPIARSRSSSSHSSVLRVALRSELAQRGDVRVHAWRCSKPRVYAATARVRRAARRGKCAALTDTPALLACPRDLSHIPRSPPALPVGGRVSRWCCMRGTRYSRPATCCSRAASVAVPVGLIASEITSPLRYRRGRLSGTGPALG